MYTAHMPAACCVALQVIMAPLTASTRMVLCLMLVLATFMLMPHGTAAKGSIAPEDGNFFCWSCGSGWCSEYGRRCDNYTWLSCRCLA
jgi:hypothetical protein